MGIDGVWAAPERVEAMKKKIEAATRLGNLDVARQMEEKLGVTAKNWNNKTDKLKERRRIKFATGWERGRRGMAVRDTGFYC
jgi:hypothetical protein